MKIRHLLLSFAVIVDAIDEETKESIRTSFALLNSVYDIDPTTATDEPSPAVANLAETHYFYKSGPDNWTFAIAAPENPAANDLATFMVVEAARSYRDHGFQCASRLLQFSLYTFFTMEVTESGKVAVFYATHCEDKLEIVNTGYLWAGLYRHGDLICATKKIDETKVLHLSPEEFFRGLQGDGDYVLSDFKHDWRTQKGDVLVVTWSNLPSAYEEIIQLAVEAAEWNSGPVSQIVANLRAYYNIGVDEGNVFAALRIE